MDSNRRKVKANLLDAQPGTTEAPLPPSRPSLFWRQKAVPVQTLGIATASANMFRLIRSSIGTSAFGAMFTSGTASAPPGSAEAGLGAFDAGTVSAMPPQAQAQDAVLEAFALSLHPACLLKLLLAERPLATSLPATEAGG